MKIETKYNLGDIVHYINDNKLYFGKIINIEVNKVTPYISTFYMVEYCGKYSVKNFTIELGEKELFNSKEELLASLL